ncbi:hypothetical protein, partial [Oceanobacillus caeni]|uniref:hypothetical protein n=1 Tax=Oceanobacillus caeni TaxID=405946 RepID=UPI002E1EA2E3|nr:hypothetical protein [Oceanobacillus caeni]
RWLSIYLAVAFHFTMKQKELTLITAKFILLFSNQKVNTFISYLYIISLNTIQKADYAYL